MFKVDDRVIDCRGSLGTVVKIIENTSYPVRVEFDYTSYGEIAFTLDGRYVTKAGTDSLYNIRKLTPLEKAMK